jgi:hypothetical protein
MEEVVVVWEQDHHLDLRESSIALHNITNRETQREGERQRERGRETEREREKCEEKDGMR